MSRMQFDLDLRGQIVEVDVAICGADPSVGIMNEYGEDEIITDADGNTLDWELTDEEWWRINEVIANVCNDDDY